MIPAGTAPNVRREAGSLDGQFVNEYVFINSSRSDLTTEAVEQLEDISRLPEDKLRIRLITFATQREAIPAASYADHLVARFAEEPAPLGRTFSFALRNAWQDEALHTQFLVECVPRSSGAKVTRKLARLSGKAAGIWSAYIFDDPGRAALLLQKAIVQFAVKLPRAPVNAIRSLRPMTTSEYFDATVNFEYAAALGWKVIASANLPQREMSRGSGELNRLEWRSQDVEPADIGRMARRIEDTEIRHAKVFWQLANTSTSSHSGLIAALVAINDAFVAPEFRIPRVPRGPFAVQVRGPADDHTQLIEDLLKVAPRRNGTPGTPGLVALAIGDCSPATAEMVALCFSDSPQWRYRTIGAPNGLRLTPDDRPMREVFEFEAGCAWAHWPMGWTDADVRISIADLGSGRQPGLSMGALSRLVEVFPVELRQPLRGSPDPQLYALMWLLERYPPDFSIIFAGDKKVFYDSEVEAVVFDDAVVKHNGLRRSTGLEEAIRWFGPLVPEVA